MTSTTIKIYKIKQRNNWSGPDTIYDAYCLTQKQPREWFDISGFEKKYPNWRDLIDETNRRGKEIGDETFFTQSSEEDLTEISEKEQDDLDDESVQPSRKRRRMTINLASEDEEVLYEEQQEGISNAQGSKSGEKISPEPLKLMFTSSEDEESSGEEENMFTSLNHEDQRSVDGVLKVEEEDISLFKLVQQIAEPVIISSESEEENKQGLGNLFKPKSSITDVILIDSD